MSRSKAKMKNAGKSLRSRRIDRTMRYITCRYSVINGVEASVSTPMS